MDQLHCVQGSHGPNGYAAFEGSLSHSSIMACCLLRTYVVIEKKRLRYRLYYKGKIEGHGFDVLFVLSRLS